MSPSTYFLIFLSALSTVRLEFLDDEYEDSDDLVSGAQTLVRQSRRPPHSSDFDTSRFIRRPRPKQMNPEYLKELLGDNFDPKYMSIEEPNVAEEVESEVPDDRFQMIHMRKEMKKFNLTQELVEAGIPSDVFEVIEKWLYKRGSCPLVHKWHNIGPFFWPPWIRRAECLEKYTFCSWPNGMHCVPATNIGLTVLRWQCKERRRKAKGRKTARWASDLSSTVRFSGKRRPKMRCQWVHANYPVTNECMCTC
ncbi:noggin-like [Centruroides vittatus]|uniref:noggin-like n=1 Tax=Centruroides vittatus TaxID=120091 RepID=UPI00350F519E